MYELNNNIDHSTQFHCVILGVRNELDIHSQVMMVTSHHEDKIFETTTSVLNMYIVKSSPQNYFAPWPVLKQREVSFNPT